MSCIFQNIKSDFLLSLSPAVTLKNSEFAISLTQDIYASYTPHMQHRLFLLVSLTEKFFKEKCYVPCAAGTEVVYFFIQI
jgi:hypothetical protein